LDIIFKVSIKNFLKKRNITKLKEKKRNQERKKERIIPLYPQKESQ